MEFRNLADTPIANIVDCLNVSFAEYFVPLPKKIAFWQDKFHRARVDYALSFGAFDQGQLVGFIINGIDYRANVLTAFNSGTGVLPAYRGRQLVDQIYDYALPLLQSKGVRQCVLEVIEQNDRAIRVYERIGFKKRRKLYCFGSKVKGPEYDVVLRQVEFPTLIKKHKINDSIYSWDNDHQAIITGADYFTSYEVFDQNEKYIGYFVINEPRGYLAQFDCADIDLGKLLSGVAQLADTYSCNNIDESRLGIMEGLKNYDWKNSINQYEMEWGMTP